MKFKQGDVLSFNCGKAGFLAGLIISTENTSYGIVLINYRNNIPIRAVDIYDSQVFGLLYSTDEQSLSVLDTIILEPADIDEEPGVEVATHIDIPGILAHAGLFPMAFSTRQLLDYFEEGLTARGVASLDFGTMAFESKMLIPLLQFLATAPIPNELPTVKLYKDVDGVLHYFQIYDNSHEPLGLVVHNGKLGETGEFTEILDQPLDELKEIYAQALLAKRAAGYTEWPSPIAMILQFPTSDDWGHTDDLDYRNDVSDYLDKYLFWTGNGRTTGGDIGSGTINIFFEVIESEIVVPMIVQVLAEKPVERQFIIASVSYREATELTDGEAFVRVVYPADFKGEFFY